MGFQKFPKAINTGGKKGEDINMIKSTSRGMGMRNEFISPHCQARAHWGRWRVTQQGISVLASIAWLRPSANQLMMQSGPAQASTTTS